MPIHATTKLHRLEESLGAAEVRLTGEDLARIEQALASVQIQGPLPRFVTRRDAPPSPDKQRDDQ